MTGFDLDFGYEVLRGPLIFVLLAAFGLLVGILTGIFGVGGGFMIVPLLNLLFGVDYSLAVGSSLGITTGTGAAGVSRHWRLHNVEVKAALLLGCGSVVGTLVGSAFHDGLRHHLGTARFDQVMDIFFILLLSTTAWMVFRGNPEGRVGKSLLQRLKLPPRTDLPQAQLKDVSLPGIVAVGFLVGIMTGLLGIGGGVLFMPLLLLVVGLNAHQAVGTSLGVVLFSSITGTIKYGSQGYVNLWLVMTMLVGSTIGVQIGSRICQRLQAKSLRRWFALLVALLVLSLVIKLAVQLIRGAGDEAAAPPAVTAPAMD